MLRSAVILPPSCIGILGGGQLGRMLAMVAKHMGYKVAILEPSIDCPAKSFADYHIQTPYNDQNGLTKLANLAQVVTTEFENVPAETIQYLTQLNCPTYPQANAITIAQNRLLEKNFFKNIDFDTVDFTAITNLEDCNQAEDKLFPGILKTTTQGYDGKGQRKVKNQEELKLAYAELGGECILEHKIDLAKEVSIIVARNQYGVCAYPLIENEHVNGILDMSAIPANIDFSLANKARSVAEKMVEALDYTGILTIEFFISIDNCLLVNEIAPRPHNSGHVTIEACVTSQFEQQLRAVCGLPLGDTALKQNGMMLNLLGDIWLKDNDNPFSLILQHDPNIKLHWYDKETAKPGRKMGHVTITGNETQRLKAILIELKHKLKIIN